MRTRKIHIWQFPEEERILVKLDRALLTRIPKYNVKKLRTKKAYIKFNKLLNYCKIYNIPLAEIEENILSYKTDNASRIITNPKLPLIVDPIFDMVLSHHFFDGYFDINNKAGYKQVKDKNLQLNFKLKLEHILGKIEGNIVKKDVIFTPRFLIKIFKQIYGITMTNSYKNRIPNAIKNKSKLYKIAVITASICDEGAVDKNRIIIYSNNLKLLLDIYELTKQLKYKCKLIKRKTGQNSYELHILSLSRYYKDFMKLVNKYPFLTLSRKEKLIKFHIDKEKRTWWRKNVGETKKLIVNLLSKKSMGPRELESILNIDVSRIRRHLNQLMKWNILKRNNGTWYLNKNKKQSLEEIYKKTHKQFIELKKKKEISKENIMNAIIKGFNTVPDIADIVNLAKTTVSEYLRLLYREGKVKKEGHKVIGKAVFTTWNIL